MIHMLKMLWFLKTLLQNSTCCSLYSKKCKKMATELSRSVSITNITTGMLKIISLQSSSCQLSFCFLRCLGSHFGSLQRSSGRYSPPSKAGALNHILLPYTCPWQIRGHCQYKNHTHFQYLPVNVLRNTKHYLELGNIRGKAIILCCNKYTANVSTIKLIIYYCTCTLSKKFR